jgi:hypothetical protein
MLNLKNKKAEELVSEELIFIILNTIFFLVLVLFIVRVGSSDNSLEEQYAKKIALVLDQMKPNMEVTMDISELYALAVKNKYTGENNLLVLPIKNGKISVKASSRGGYSFYTFSSLKPKLTFDSLTKKVTIKT